MMSSIHNGEQLDGLEFNPSAIPSEELVTKEVATAFPQSCSEVLHLILFA